MPEEPPRHGVTKDAGRSSHPGTKTHTFSGDSRERNELVCDRERELTVRVHIHKISVEVKGRHLPGCTRRQSWRRILALGHCHC